MNNKVNLTELIERGGLYYGIEGTTFKEVYKNLSRIVELPSDLTPEEFYDELCTREEIMSTAVGRGVAIPHPRYPLLEHFEEQRVIVCFLKEPLHIQSPDAKPLFALFVVLSSNKATHLGVLADLASLFQNADFIKGLEKQPKTKKLLKLVNKYLKKKRKVDEQKTT